MEQEVDMNAKKTKMRLLSQMILLVRVSKVKNANRVLVF